MIRIAVLALCAATLVGPLPPVMAAAKERQYRAHRIPAPMRDPALDDAPYNRHDPFWDFGSGYIGEPVLYGTYHGDGSCMFVRQRGVTPYGWRFRPVRICG